MIGTFLVTGGAGFIGSHLVDALVERGDAVTVIDDFSTGKPENLVGAVRDGTVTLIEGSVDDRKLVEDQVTRVDAVFHLAAAVGVELILRRPLDSLIRNTRGSEVVIGAASQHGRRLLFASTSEIYGKGSDGSFTESSDRLLGPPATLRWSYATAKAFGESLVRAHQRENGAEGLVVRIFNTVGPRQSGVYGMVLPRFVNQALAGKPITVHGDGSQSRCFTHVADTVTAMLALQDAKRASGGTFNIGSPVEVPIIELARQVIERTGSDSDIEFVPYEHAYGDDYDELGRRKPDITAIRQTVDWEPTRDLTRMIDDVVAYERARSGAEVTVSDTPS